jgi:hypothetical protein
VMIRLFCWRQDSLLTRFGKSYLLLRVFAHGEPRCASFWELSGRFLGVNPVEKIVWIWQKLLKPEVLQN